MKAFAWTALVALLASMLTPLGALAEEAVAKTQLNVRSGPGSSYRVVDTLEPGERVEMVECRDNGWCYITHPGPDGWVASRYLKPPRDMESGESDCRFELKIGSDGPRFAIVCGDEDVFDRDRDRDRWPGRHQVCFFTGRDYRGDAICRDPGTYNVLSSRFDNRISSIRVGRDARVRMCTRRYLRGDCETFESSRRLLPADLNDRVSSFRITRLPADVHSRGRLGLDLGERADLDRGRIGYAGADIWYRGALPIPGRLMPVNGARFALGDGSDRGYDGCADENFSSRSIPFVRLAPGTHVCVRTSAGRIGQFRITSRSPARLGIRYTVWED